MEAFWDRRPTDDPEVAIAEYRLGVDRTMVRQSLRLTPGQRLHRLQGFVRFLEQLRKAEATRLSPAARAPAAPTG